QTQKLLPVRYFMVTFTLPRELRPLAKQHSTVVYNALFQCALDTLQTFGHNKPGFNAELAMTAVLHTHTRRLDYHPHVHCVVPGGGVNRQRQQWRTLKGKYLFNGRQLARVFRAKLLAALRKAGLQPPQVPGQWVVNCKNVGSGLPALTYLSRYLYRGVISDRNILTDDGQTVTFQYKDSATNTLKTRSLPGETFMALVLQHVLPKRFRRVRDYGFLHGNGKRLLRLVQWVLQVAIPPMAKTPRPAFLCPNCQQPMAVVGFRPKRRTG
ncbi:IS91 family transposase, partial [Porticoccus sp. GXU_MW_L64]